MHKLNTRTLGRMALLVVIGHVVACASKHAVGDSNAGAGGDMGGVAGSTGGVAGSTGTSGSTAMPATGGSGGGRATGGMPGNAGASAGMGGRQGRAGTRGGAGMAGSLGQSGSGGSAVPRDPTFTNVYAIFKTNCAGSTCHINASRIGDMLSMADQTTAYNNLVGVDSVSCTGEKRVVAGDSDKSELVHTLNRTRIGSCTRTPQMPDNRAKLMQADIDVVVAWVKAGAPNN